MAASLHRSPLLASSARAGEHRLWGWDCYGPPYSSLLLVRLSLRDDWSILNIQNSVKSIFAIIILGVSENARFYNTINTLRVIFFFIFDVKNVKLYPMVRMTDLANAALREYLPLALKEGVDGNLTPLCKMKKDGKK